MLSFPLETGHAVLWHLEYARWMRETTDEDITSGFKVLGVQVLGLHGKPISRSETLWKFHQTLASLSRARLQLCVLRLTTRDEGAGAGRCVALHEVAQCAVLAHTPALVTDTDLRPAGSVLKATCLEGNPHTLLR